MEKNFSPLEREIYNLTGLETKREYRHFRPEGYLRDMEKYNEAAACGWLVIRTIPSELLRVKTIQQIVRACRKKLTTSSIEN